MKIGLSVILGILSISSTLWLTACSGGTSSGEDARAQQQRDAKTLEDLFSGVQGTWSGTVSNPSSGLQDFDADLKLYVYYIQDGANPDGSVRVRPTLRGRFQPKNFVAETDLVNLIGDYDRSGRLVMTAQPVASSPGSAAAPGLTITASTLSVGGSVSQGNMEVAVTREGGVWGIFKATRTSTSSTAPSAGEQTEYRDRFIRINGPWEGSYRGTLRSVDGNDYGVEISLLVLDRPMESGGSRPILIAQYRRLDVPTGSIEWALVVDFNSQTGEVLMKNDPSAGGGGSGVPGGMTLSVSGTLKDFGGVKTMDVTVRNRASVLGKLKAVNHSAGSPGLPFMDFSD